MNVAAPDCILEVKTDGKGKVTWVSVCAWCEDEKRETSRLGLWCASVGVKMETQVSHGMCRDHMEKVMRQSGIPRP